jgi:hypothetical protein
MSLSQTFNSPRPALLKISMVKPRNKTIRAGQLLTASNSPTSVVSTGYMAAPPALTTDSKVDHLESPEQAPLFPPRLILLRMLEESRDPAPAASRIDPSKIIMSTTSHNTISVDKANILQSQRGCGCDTVTTHHHDLSCGHLVATSTGFPDPYNLEALCTSNRKRSQPTTHITLTPFVCPLCLEKVHLRNYIKTYKEFTAAGYVSDPDPARNVKKGLCCSIRLPSKFGLRIFQGTSGLFLDGDEEKFLPINFMPSVVSEMYGRWSFESRQRPRSRVRSQPRNSDNAACSVDDPRFHCNL